MPEKYLIKKATKVRCGITAFTAPEGQIIEVKQTDNVFSKVLIDFGGGCIDWFSDSWLARNAERQQQDGGGNE